MFNKVVYICLVIKVIFLLYCECQNGLDLSIFSNTTCQNDRFNCSNGQVIPCSDVCDGRKNCADSSDETFLACRNVYCTDDQFRCSYGGCISSSLECNGVQDCIDNSDETSLNCPGVIGNFTRNKNCTFGFFQCEDQTCIREDEVCDGKQDCQFLNSDETEEQCSNHYCPEENFRCNYGACILSVNVCDGVENCFDGSDEHDKCPKSVSLDVGTHSSPGVSSGGSGFPLDPSRDLGGGGGSFGGDGGSVGGGVGFGGGGQGGTSIGGSVDSQQGQIVPVPFAGVAPASGPAPAVYSAPVTPSRPSQTPQSDERYLLTVYRSIIVRVLQDLNQIEQNILRTVQTQDLDRAFFKEEPQSQPNLPTPLIPPTQSISPGLFQSPPGFKSQQNNDMGPSTAQLFGTDGGGIGGRSNNDMDEGDCYLDQSQNLLYFDQNGDQIYDTNVRNGYTINYDCIGRIKKLSSETSNICANGMFINDHPKCITHCSSVALNSLSVQASCRTQTGETISCSGLLPVGTVAILTCKVGYKKPDTVVNDAVTCTETGEWDPPLFKCQQICGIIQDAEATIVGGFKTNITQVPWHAAIYEARPEKVEQICGGSIINPTAIVTAAHCFWNGQKQEVYPAARYRVIVGKTLREFSASEPLTQMFKIKTIDTYDQYRDYNGLFVADIAVLVLEKPIIFAPHIKPICIEFSLKNNERYVASGLKGRVAGWGLTSSGGEPSSVLKVIDLPTVDYNTCIKVSPPDFVPFVTSDKFCGGFTTGESVCVGDSGGAMALARPVGNNQVYFLRGIVSTGPRLENSCDNNKYSAFTDVQLNIVFLYKYISSAN